MDCSHRAVLLQLCSIYLKECLLITVLQGKRAREGPVH